jgi:hypothetical protein
MKSQPVSAVVNHGDHPDHDNTACCKESFITHGAGPGGHSTGMRCRCAAAWHVFHTQSAHNGNKQGGLHVVRKHMPRCCCCCCFQLVPLQAGLTLYSKQGAVPEHAWRQPWLWASHSRPTAVQNNRKGGREERRGGRSLLLDRCYHCPGMLCLCLERWSPVQHCKWQVHAAPLVQICIILGRPCCTHHVDFHAGDHVLVYLEHLSDLVLPPVA